MLTATAATPAPAATEKKTITAVVTPLYTSEPSPAAPVESVVVVAGAGAGGWRSVKDVGVVVVVGGGFHFALCRETIF